MLKQVVPAGMESRIAFLPALFIFIALCFNPGAAHSAEDIYGGLKQKLVQDGFSRQQVANAFQCAPPPMFRLVSRTMKIREGEVNYDHFLAPSEIADARQFIADHRNCFRRAQAAYGVEPEIIAAILLVETHLGSYTGKTPTLAILSTFAVMNLKSNRDKVWKLLSPQDRQKWGREAFDMKLIDRSGWAYRELSALMELKNTHGIQPGSLKGSVMGAIGLPQFLPSSLVKFGADGNGDGRIDLYNAEDAIFSTANYLRGHGWCEAKFASDREAVIWDYNHSKAYVRIVLGIAERIRGEAM
jgi:membrane-bound lytic murein transglycosylase B